MNQTGSLDERDAASHTTVSFGTALRFWFKLGLISFGGPAGQIAVMHTELVERKRWISERRFLHALNYCMVLPGPEAQQLATYIGWLLHGTLGGIAAGALFVLPSLALLVALSWIYMAFGTAPAIEGVFYGVKPAVVAIVAFAVVRVGRRAIRHPAALAIAALAFLAMAVWSVPFPLVIAAAGVCGLVGGRIWPHAFTLSGKHGASAAASAPHPKAIIDDDHVLLPHTAPSWPRFFRRLAVGLLLWGAPLLALGVWQSWHGTHFDMAVFFTQAALVTFGGAYAVLPYAGEFAIAAGWIDARQLIAGLALGESTPGPLIMVLCFIGFVGGWQQPMFDPPWASAVAGAMVATYFTFLPSFLFILLGAPWIEQMRGELRLTAILSGITAAVVGVILNLAVFVARHVLLPEEAPAVSVGYYDLGRYGGIDVLAVAIACAALVALWRFKRDLVLVVLSCGAVGLAARLLAE